MKKTILLTIAALMTLSVNAQVASTVTQWSKLLDAAPPDMGCSMLMHDQALFILSCTGSTIGDGGSGFPKDYTDPTRAVNYDGTQIATGAAYEGASYNNNLNLIKTDLDGTLQWCVYSTSGDMSSNNGGVVAASDGGVYVSVVMRQTDNLRTEPLRLVDATGQETVIDWRLDSQESKRWWQGFLIKVSREGAIEWTRTIAVSNAPQPSATGENVTHTSSAFYIDGMESDDEGNFYVSGRYVNPITLQRADGTSVTLVPHNTSGWSGDSQESRGDMFVAKFNSDGYLVKTLTTTGVAQVETSMTLARCDDGLLLNGVVTGQAGGSTIALDGHEVSLPDQASMLTARLDRDLNVDWLQLFAGDKCGGRNSAIQSNRIQAVGDHIWITGMGNFTLTSQDGTQSIATQTGNVREGFVICCDKATGQWIKGACSKQGPMAELNGICGYAGGFENEDGSKFYAYGYTFASRMIETDDDIEVEGYGVLLVEHDALSLEVTDMCSLIAGGSMSTAQDMIATGNRLYTLSRGTNKDTPEWALKPIGSDLRHETNEWAVVVSAFELPFQVKENAQSDPTKKGDVNGDGTVDVADVNQVINVMLGKTASDAARMMSDVTADGNVDVSDVNAVINIMLGKQ